MGVGHGARQFFFQKNNSFLLFSLSPFFLSPPPLHAVQKNLTQKLPPLCIERIHLRDRVILVVRLKWRGAVPSLGKS
jgi:hypothetical protein